MQRLTVLVLAVALTACATADEESWPFTATPIAQFEEPWAMTFLFASLFTYTGRYSWTARIAALTAAVNVAASLCLARPLGRCSMPETPGWNWTLPVAARCTT